MSAHTQTSQERRGGSPGGVVLETELSTTHWLTTLNVAIPRKLDFFFKLKIKIKQPSRKTSSHSPQCVSAVVSEV